MGRLELIGWMRPAYVFCLVPKVFSRNIWRSCHHFFFLNHTSFSQRKLSDHTGLTFEPIMNSWCHAAAALLNNTVGSRLLSVGKAQSHFCICMSLANTGKCICYSCLCKGTGKLHKLVVDGNCLPVSPISMHITTYEGQLQSFRKHSSKWYLLGQGAVAQ